jgi:hypothetical protein
MNKTLATLRAGRKLRVKHSDLNLYINAMVKLDNANLVLDSLKISLPQKASKLEKLLLKLVQIYCNDVLINNMYNEVLTSKEYQKLKHSVSTAS